MVMVLDGEETVPEPAGLKSKAPVLVCEISDDVMGLTNTSSFLEVSNGCERSADDALYHFHHTLQSLSVSYEVAAVPHCGAALNSASVKVHQDLKRWAFFSLPRK